MPTLKISSPPYEQLTLTDQSLVYLAQELSAVESRLIIITMKITDNFCEIRIENDNKTPQSRQNFVEQLRYAPNLLQSIRNGQNAFSDNYLKDSGLEVYWQRIALTYSQIPPTSGLQGGCLGDDIDREVAYMIEQARRIPGILYYLVAKNKLNHEIREHSLLK